MKLYSLVFAILLLTFPACTAIENVNQNTNQSLDNSSNPLVSVKNDSEELAKIINLPVMPEEADWREEAMTNQETGNISDQTSKRLIAVLYYLPEDVKKLLEILEKNGAAKPVEFGTETWFPGELIAQGQTSGNDTIKGLEYSVQDFIQPPYENGKLTHVSETDYFVLELFTK